MPMSTESQEDLTEELHVEQFHDGKVLATFNFTRTISGQKLEAYHKNHYSLFPRTIGEIIQAYGVEELHLTFTQGRWNYDKWGYSQIAAPTGVELWAWFDTEDVDLKWKGLTNALAGAFCASLNFIDQAVTAEPEISFQPEGYYPAYDNPQSSSIRKTSGFQLRYGTLPHEITCTENLTPWSKLLPCQTKSGIATLFNPYKIFDVDFHSMALHWKPICVKMGKHGCKMRKLELVQTVAAVFDPIRYSASRTTDWTFNNLIGRSVSGPCPLATNTKVSVTAPKTSGLDWYIHPVNTSIEEATGKITAEYDLATSRLLDLGIIWAHPYANHTIDRRNAPVKVHRYLTGYGRERGGISMQLYNYDSQHPVTVTVLESIPWFLKLYMHTLKVETRHWRDDGPYNSTVLKSGAESILYQPAIDRIRPSVIELTITLPPESMTSVSFDFDRAFIKYTEHPPDANRGFDIGPAVVTIHPNEFHKAQRLYSETLLIALPTPDFSMPYNVITMTCTILALYFGSLFNLLTRRFEPVRNLKNPPMARPLLRSLRVYGGKML
ncbi:hypothetical protein HDV05_000735 [Chytridiales sp. JEL 0842]|nr:hypothetical protein HDV05_000735 [Chytridiales sp. JEL 0842]